MGTDEDVQDLHATSAQIRADAERILAIEDEKRRIDPTSPRFRELALEAQQTADEVDVLTAAESQLAEALADEPGLGPIGAEDGTPGPANEPAGA